MERTVVISLLEVHIDDTTRPNTIHLVTEERLNLSELARSNFVAAVFGEEDGDGVIRKLLGAVLIPGFGIRRISTPGVDIVSPEVDTVLLGLTVEVIRQLHTDTLVVVGSISNTKTRPVVLGFDVSFHVPNSCFDKCACVSRLHGIGDLVAGKEPEGVAEPGHGVNDVRVPGVQCSLPAGIVAVDGLGGVREVGYNVDAGIGEHVHACRVVLCWVDGVDADRVGVEVLQDGNIALARCLVGEGVLVAAVGARCAVGGVVLFFC